MTTSLDHLPKQWVKTTLKELVQPNRPKHSPQDYPDLQFIGMENIEAHSMKLLGTVPASSMRSNAVHFYPGDVLYGRLRPYLNKVYRADFEGLCSAEFIVFPAREWLQPKFLQYFLNSSAFVSFASHLNAGDRPRVDFDQIGKYPTPLAPLKEQDRIVEEIERQFTRLDAAVAALKRVQANLKRYRAGVLKAACEGRLVPTEADVARREGRSYEPASVLLDRIRASCQMQLPTTHGSAKAQKDRNGKEKHQEPSMELPTLVVPEGWTRARVRQVGEVITGFTPPTSNQGNFGGSIPFFKPTDLDAGYYTWTARDTLSEAGANRGRLLPANAILVTCIGATIGKTGLARVAGATNQQINALVAPEKYLVPEWLFFWFIGPLGQDQIKSNASSTTLPILNKSRFEDLILLIPPFAEQRRLVSELERRLSIINDLEMQLQACVKRAERLRQATLKNAFGGKLVPQDASDEPASTLLERMRGTANLGCAPLARSPRGSRRKSLRPKETASA